MAQQHMAMAAMGGPVGGQMGQPVNTSTPSNQMTPENVMRKLNTAIYEYMLCHGKYEIARSILDSMPVDTTDIKQSPKNQANGIDSSMDIDSKENLNMKNRPEGLPAPSGFLSSSDDHPFLQDWWCQFWDLWKGQRGSGKNQTTLQYIGYQRQAQKARQGLVGMDGNALNGGMRQQFQGPMTADSLRLQAMQRQMGNKPGQMQPGRPNMPNQGPGNPMQASGMERQGSAMNMDARNSGSPNTGDNAPSPKRLRTEGSLQQLNQPRSGPPGQGNLPTKYQKQSVEAYSQAMKQQVQAIQNSNANPAMKGMNPNPAGMGPAGGQPNALGQPGSIDNPNDFYGGNRMGMPNGGAAGAAQAAAQQQANGNHALQDYQMQLMLLEQQNKKRLLMARQEQDNLPGQPHPQGMPGNPANGVMDPNMPNMNNPAMRAMMVNGMRPQGAHPMDPQMQQMMAARMGAGGMMPGGAGFPPGQQPGGPPQGGMMPGQPQQQQPPQGGQPQNMTPRQGNMAPPPAPANAAANGANQPSSPAQPPAPPTPTQNKGGKNAKKDGKNSKAPAKKGAAAAAAEADAPPTPTPPPAATPNAAGGFKNGQNGPNANGPQQAGGPNAGANANNGQPQGQQPQQQPPHMGGGPPDMNNIPFGVGDLTGDFGGVPGAMEFADPLSSGDVLDTFDFESFLNNGDDNNFGFDANLAFGDSIEADLGS